MNKLNFSAEYSERSDDELLLLASDRDSLTGEASTALDAELRRRNLTQSDQAKYQQFVKHNEQREARERRRRVWKILLDLFWALVVMALISCTYLALNIRYHLKPDWQESAVDGTADGGDAAVRNHNLVFPSVLETRERRSTA